jgi:N-ethylmaleimide reductase
MNTNIKTRTLFEPLNFNGIEFTNSIVMAPMTRARAIGTIPNNLMAAYYAQRATAGLIITEGTAPSPGGLGYARTPGIFSQEQINAWKEITNAVHRKGGKIFVQLMHVGRIAHSANMPEGTRIIAPSAIASNGMMWTDSLGMQKEGTPAEMTLSDIQNTIEQFVQGAKNSIEAGFDGVELHGANGYLMEQFLSPHSNQRNDNYGASIKNRSRFVLEVTKAVADAIGKEKVGLRISPYSTFNDMPVYDDIAETYSYLSNEISKLDILYLHLIDYAARTSDEGIMLIKTIRNNFNNLLILNGGYTKERADRALNEDGADLVSFGSSFLANPDLPYKLKNNIPLNPPDPNTFYTADEVGYTDYSFAGTEFGIPAQAANGF